MPSMPTAAERRSLAAPTQSKTIKISPESPLSGQQGQFALAVLGFVHRTQGPDSHQNSVLAIYSEPSTRLTCGFVWIPGTWAIPIDPQFKATSLTTLLP